MNDCERGRSERPRGSGKLTGVECHPDVGRAHELFTMTNEYHVRVEAAHASIPAQPAEGNASKGHWQ